MLYPSLAILLVAQCQAATEVYLASTPPSYAQPLPKDFLGLSLEYASFSAWAGGVIGTPNAFVTTALGSLQRLTGVAVPLRVGGEWVEWLFTRLAQVTLNQQEALKTSLR